MPLRRHYERSYLRQGCPCLIGTGLNSDIDMTLNTEFQAPFWQKHRSAMLRWLLLGLILLAFARVAGETAPLLFTAFGNRFWSQGWNQPTAALPEMIYRYAISPYDDWHRQAWAAGLVLLGLILIINIVARAILSRGIAVPRT